MWLNTILAILKFLLTELPDFLERWERVKKDKKYATQKQKRATALLEYKKNPNPSKLKMLEEQQK